MIKLYLQELPNPLIPIKYIPLPIKDTADYSSQVFLSLPETTQKLFKDLIPVTIGVIANKSRTYQSLKSISSDLAPCFIGRYASNKENLTIAVRFTKNLIDYWSEISSADSDLSSSSSDSESEKEHESAITSRKSSYDKYPKALLSSGIKDSYHEILPGGISKHLPTGFASRNSSTTSISSAQSLSNGTVFHPHISDSTGRLKSKSEDCLLNIPAKTPSPLCSSTPPPPPPPPPLRKSASTAFRSENSRQDVKLNGRKSMSNLDEQPESLKSINVSTKRGKMVAELAKLYEV